MKNAVFFGPAHAGKSTLAGYLVAQLSPKFDLTRFLAGVKAELGLEYDTAQSYAYIVDTAKDERRRGGPGQSRGLGQSRKMHYYPVELAGLRIGVIDTPGAEHRYRERVKGMTFGEIGIFVIEAGQLVHGDLLSLESYDALQRFFTPLLLWHKLRDSRDLIVVLSKMDILNFAKEEYTMAANVIRTVLNKPHLRVIPIAVEVAAGRSHNVSEAHGALGWFEGPTLLQEIRRLAEIEDPSLRSQPMFGFVDRQFDKDGVGRILRAKMLAGHVNVGDQVQIAPVEYRGSKGHTLVGRVQSLMYERGELTKQADVGALVGLNLRDQRISERRCKASDVCTQTTSCLYSSGIELNTGNLIRLQMSPEDGEQLGVPELVRLLWYGRAVSCYVVSRAHIGERAFITLEFFNECAALPKYQEQASQTSAFIIMKDNGTYLTGLLDRLGEPGETYWSVVDMDAFGAPIEQHMSDFSYSIQGDTLRFPPMGSVIDLIHLIRSIHSLCSEEGLDQNVSVTIRGDVPT